MRCAFLNAVLCATALASLPGCAGPRFSGGSSAGESSWSRFENSHVFVPSRYPEGNWSQAVSRFEDVWFEAADGTRLNGWFATHEEPRAVVLLAHGNAGNITSLAPLLERLRDAGQVSVFAFDYRGYGKSDGQPDEAGILEDTRAARRWLAHRTNVDERDVVLMGISLGGGAVVDLAAKEGTRGLVLVSTFTSLPDVAGHHWPLVPTRLLMHNRLDSLSKIDKYSGPLLQIHGDADRMIPISQGQALFAKARDPKRFLVSRGADHNDPLPPEFDAAFKDFVGRLPTAKVLPPPPRWRPAGEKS